jgi:integrase
MKLLKGTETYVFFIYLCNGLNVADLIKLKYSNIVDGEICFVRQKTEKRAKNQKLIRVALIPALQHIIDKWGNLKVDSNYIFPYLEGGESDEERYKKTRELYKRINKRMKLIGEEIGIENITTYTARHVKELISFISATVWGILIFVQPNHTFQVLKRRTGQKMLHFLSISFNPLS